jgi:Domain of unknown function (DUF4157)/L,D-transpeptidase catalytic domain
VLRSPGRPLDASVRADLEPRFGADFGHVRIHTDAQAAASARAVNALAYTFGRDIVFGAGQHEPQSPRGRDLLAHELAHVTQLAPTAGVVPSVPDRVAPADSPREREADAAADAALRHARVPRPVAAPLALYRRPAPYIKQIKVHLTPPQNAELEWEGTPPAGAKGSDAFTVSTGKGYSDPGDPPGTCVRSCCKDADKQCAPPWNTPDKVGACCTPFGNTFWTGTPREEHNGWSWWTPIQPFYAKRGIALHQHPEVTGQPIGHGCVRMADENAKRIFDFSNGKRTKVTIDGRAAPVLCEKDRRCGAGGAGGGAGALRERDEDLGTASVPPIPGLEGVMT